MRRDVMEVETPLLSRSTATDPYLASIEASVHESFSDIGETYYLHTSPEFPMKRLLAAGSGAIYQICKTFRDAESGKRHNPEFTMLEWYRPGFSLKDLMNEVADLIGESCHLKEFKYLSYRDAFRQYLEIDPFEIEDLALRDKVAMVTACNTEGLDRDDCLNLLISHAIEPNLGREQPTFLCAYPASQASLAKTSETEDGHAIAERFELYINGLEIANGYFELTDAKEQRLRFEEDNHQRQELGLPLIPVDENLLQAMESGLPSCAGVALGLDRLLMIQQKLDHIDEVLSFPISRA